jgi:hypothetical protein
MKKLMVAAVGMVIIFSMAGTGYAQTRTLKSSLSCGHEVCEVYTLGRGTLEIVCVEKTESGSIQNLLDYNCPTMGNKQACTSKTTGKVVLVNPYDTDAVKCHKVCGGCL